jgi:DNA repair protein RecO (recombination protein O)
MYVKTKALVIQVTEYRDSDVLLQLLTPEYGKITAKAKGARRKNNPMSASCQLLAFSEFTLFEYRQMYTMNEASVIELFMPIRKDLQKLALGTYFAQVSGAVAQEDAPSGEILSLVTNCLYALSTLDLPEKQVKSVFEIRIVGIAGYTPNLNCCIFCGEGDPVYFDFDGGVLLCADCIGLHQSTVQKIDVSVLDTLRYIVNCESKRIFSFRVGEDTLSRLAYLAETYLLSQFELSFPTLAFYKSLPT